nr:MAG: RNA-dependent RNA polymerase [Porcine picobirnavirus]
MKVSKLTQSQRDTIDNNSGLQRYLDSLLKGKAFTPRSWLYEDKQPDEILALWKKHLSRLENGSIFEQRVFQFDISQEAKWGPQGGVAPIQDLMEIIEEGYKQAASPRPKVFDSKEWAFAKQMVRSELLRHAKNLRPASYKHVVDDMRARDTLESNSGWPLFTRRSKPEVKQAAITDAENGNWKTYPAIALFRNYNQKTRLVWMFPMAANLVEGSFFQPLQSALMKASKYPISELDPWVGFEACRRAMTRTYDMGQVAMASDFTLTDAHFTIHSSMEVFDVIKDCFQSQFRDMLRESIEHMHSIPLIIGPDSIIEGQHGVSSGSNWTNFIETIFDMILGHYVSLRMPAIAYMRNRTKADGTMIVEGVDPEYVQLSEECFSHPDVLYCIGDDIAWHAWAHDPRFSEFLEEFGCDVGQIIKADKTTNERDYVKSLQRLFQRGYRRPDGELRAVYSTIRALKSSVFPERFHDPRKWSPDMFCVRQYMILENCVDHPLFEEFVPFVVRGNEHLIPFARKTSAQLDTALRESKLLPGLNPTYNQERRDTSLSEFASIKLAREL